MKPGTAMPRHVGRSYPPSRKGAPRLAVDLPAVVSAAPAGATGRRAAL